MIIEFIINATLTGLQSILNLLPDLPDVPVWLDSSMSFLIATATTPIALMSYVLTPTILIFAFTTFLLVTNFELVYKMFIWVLRKIPMIHIS